MMPLMLTFITTLLISAFKIFSDGLLETSIWTAMNSAKYVTLVTLWLLGLHPRTLPIAISYQHICSKRHKLCEQSERATESPKNSSWWKISLHIISACLHKIIFSRHVPTCIWQVGDMVTGLQGLTWCVCRSGCYGCYGAHVHVLLPIKARFCFPRRLNDSAFCFKCL